MQVFAPLLLRPVPPATTAPADVARANWVVAYLIARGNAGGPLASATQVNRDRRSTSVSNAASVTQQMGQMSVSAGQQEAQWYYIDAQQNYVGPVNNDGLKQLQVHKYVTSETYVWAQHLSGWVQLNTLPEMLVEGAAVAPPQGRETRGASALGGRDAAAPSCTCGGRALPSLGINSRRRQAAEVEEGGGAAAPVSGLGRLQQAAGSRPPAASGAEAASTELGGQVGFVPPATGSAVPKPSRGLVKVPNVQDSPEAHDSWNDEDGIRILTDGRLVRAIIKPDGEIVDGTGEVLAYIEDNGEVGTDEMQYLGNAAPASGQVIDANDKVVGEFDMGRGYIKDEHGSVVAEIAKTGTITGNRGQTVGVAEGFRYETLPRFAAYICLVDKAYVKGF